MTARGRVKKSLTTIQPNARLVSFYLPHDLYRALRAQAPKGRRSALIVEAVRARLQTEQTPEETDAAARSAAARSATSPLPGFASTPVPTSQLLPGLEPGGPPKIADTLPASPGLVRVAARTKTGKRGPNAIPKADGVIPPMCE